MKSKRSYKGILMLAGLGFAGLLAVSRLNAAGEEGILNVGQSQSVASNAEELVNLDYKDANLSTVIKTLAYTYDLNLVASKELEGTVTMSLKGVTVSEALDSVLAVNGYAFTRKGNLIYITPGPGLEGIDKQTVSIHLSYLTAEEAGKLLENMISEKGKVQINEATNSLLITDFASKIPALKNLIQEIDVPPIQVLIEAKIVDIQSKEFKNLGLTSSVTYAPQKGLFNRQSPTAESLVGGVTLAGPSTNIDGGQLTFTPTFHEFSGTMTLDALVQKNKAHLLASPSIATLNGKEARIIIGEKYPYKEQTQTTTGTTETTKFVDVGTTLRVTPRVSPDGWITMAVHPEVSSVSAELDAGPRITTREADAVIRVKDGETIVIGGLINKQDDNNQGGVPWIQRIPIVGTLFFKQFSSDKIETELAVFITPHILRGPGSEKQKSVLDEDIFLSVETSGEINLVSKLMQHAKHLENKRSVESANKTLSHRKLQMLNTYKMLASQFPATQNMGYMLFRMGELYENYFEKYELAAKIYERVADEQPASKEADAALFRLGVIEYERLKDYQNAAIHFERLTKEYRSSQYKRSAKAYLKKARKQLKKIEESKTN